MQTIHFAVIIVIQHVRNLTTSSNIQLKNHSLDVLKIKHSELNEKNGIYGYRSHNFNIIPRELDSTGKKIETDTTLDSLKLHIVLDKSSDIKFRRKIEPKVLSVLQNKYQTVK